MNLAQKQQTELLRNQGFGYKKIAKHLGVSVDAVKYHCKKAGLNGVMASSNDRPINRCRECLKPLQQKEKMKPLKFCSSDCRNAWWKKNRKKAIKKCGKTIQCLNCGKEFQAYEHEKRKFCSHDCYIVFRFKEVTSDE